MKIWNYTYEGNSIKITENNDTVEFYINDIMVSNGKFLSGYVTLDGSLEDGKSICASVGGAIPEGCKVTVHGKALVAS